MPNIETKRLKMMDFTYDLVEMVIKDKTELGYQFNLEAHDDWPMKDYAEILPIKLEGMREEPSRAVWSGLIIEKCTNLIIGDMGCKGGPNSEGIV